MNDPAQPEASTLPARQSEALGRELDSLLGDQLSRVRRRFMLHGLAITALLPAIVILAAFLLDHFLRLPAPIRLFNALLIASAGAWAAWRFLRYPLSRNFSRTDMALLLERTFPQLHERLVSAVQLKGSLTNTDQQVLRNQSPAMIEQLLADTASQAKALPIEKIFDNRRTARIWAAALLGVTLILGGAVTAPDTAWAFLARHLGSNVSYPRATHLLVELPPEGADLRRTDNGDETNLTVPAGADLHVWVLAQGVVPSEVFLEVTGSQGTNRTITTAPRGNARFRHVFRRVTGSFSFHARGGDDERGDRLVNVQTIHPPLVARIKAELTPPAYTGQQSIVQSGGAIETLTGSRAALSVEATNAVTQATLVFLESGRSLSLTKTTITDDAGSLVVHTGDFLVNESDRYQIELVGESGLRNPNPGTYPVTALQDYAPVGRWLQPDDASNTLRLPEGIVCVRGQARDDFGLVSGTMTIDAGDDRTASISLLENNSEEAVATNPTRQAVFVELVEISELLGQERSADGLSLHIDLVDNRQPEPNQTELPHRQVQIVDQAQLAASIGRHFRGLREQVEQALDLQTDRKARLEELLESEVLPGPTTTQLLTAVEVGQGRIQSTADRLHRGMMRAFDTHLWNRLEPSPNAAAVVDLYLAWHLEHNEAQPFLADFYRDLADRRRQGSLGAMEQTLDPILTMVVQSDRLASDLVPPTLRLLAEAQVARNTDDLRVKLRATTEAQGRIIEALKSLLGHLQEWNDYQDLVQEARALREKQREVMNRTEELRGRK